MLQVHKNLSHLPQTEFNNIPLERAIIGGILIDLAGFAKVNSVFEGKYEVFFDQLHQEVFKICLKLFQQHKPIDIIIVSEELKKAQSYDIQQARFTLLEITAEIASSANLEYHARLLYQVFLQRNMINICYQTISRVEKEDIFNLYESTLQSLKVQDPNAILKVQTMNATIMEGSTERRSRSLCGNLLKESDICFLFGDEGTGKSAIAYQIAEAVASGNSLFHLSNEVGEGIKTLVIDFEMQKRELYERYSVEGKSRYFSENLYRASIPTDADFDNLPNRIIHHIEILIERLDPKLIILDNITWIIDDSTDTKTSTAIMKKIKYLREKYHPISFIVIAHTPKRDTSLPLESRHLAGAKSLSNYCTNLIGISHSKQDPNLRYLKHLKCRNGFKEFTESNVLELILSKDTGYLQYEYHGTGPEKNHLISQDLDEVKTDIEDMILDLKEKNYSFREIATKINAQFGCNKTYATIKRWYDKRKS